MSCSKHEWHDDYRAVNVCIVNIPMEVVEDLLLLLPIKSLARFQCICKSWNSLITSTSFKLKHYKMMSNKAEILTLDYPTNNVPGFVDKDSVISILVSSSQGLSFVDTSNGIVLVKLSFSLVLWNPAMHVFVCLPSLHKIPKPPYPPVRNDQPIPSVDLVGLLFDPMIEEYEVVTGVHWSHTNQSLLDGGYFHHYSSKLSSWKSHRARFVLAPDESNRIARVHSWRRYSNSPSDVCLGGKYYWLAAEQTEPFSHSVISPEWPVIISYDFTAKDNLCHKVTVLPKRVNIATRSRPYYSSEFEAACLIEHEGALTIVTTYSLYGSGYNGSGYTGSGYNGRVCDIWTMSGEDDYGMMLWEQKFSIIYNQMTCTCHSAKDQLWHPIALKRVANGELGIVFKSTSKNFFLYDTSTGLPHGLQVGRHHLKQYNIFDSDAIKYVESMFDIRRPATSGVAGKAEEAPSERVMLTTNAGRAEGQAEEVERGSEIATCVNSDENAEDTGRNRGKRSSKLQLLVKDFFKKLKQLVPSCSI